MTDDTHTNYYSFRLFSLLHVDHLVVIHQYHNQKRITTRRHQKKTCTLCNATTINEINSAHYNITVIGFVQANFDELNPPLVDENGAHLAPSFRMYVDDMYHSDIKQ